MRLTNVCIIILKLVLETEVSSMTIFNQPACGSNDVMFSFFDDLKSKDGFANENTILSFETR